MTNEEISDRFYSHVLNESGRERVNEIADMFVTFALTLDSFLPEGREKSLVFTKLEEAKFWASAAVARNLVFQD